jgi:UDP-N-acetyl-D-mannosaminuronate dehydrogenase
LTKDKVLIVGLGEVGRTLFEILNESGRFAVYGFDIDETKMGEVGQHEEDLPSEADVMHICIPCNNPEKFVESVESNAKRFNPRLVVINSTVPPGTTMEVHKRCGSLVAHSPTRGVHRNLDHMKWELKRWTKYVGGANAEAATATSKHFKNAGLKTKVLRSCLETELAKLFETTYRAWMIVWFQEMHRISRSLEADFDETVDFLEDTHRVRLDRPIMFPGVIGGHCLIPNTELLLKSYDSELLRLILESNERRKEEIMHESVRCEAEKVETRSRRLERDLTGKKR